MESVVYFLVIWKVLQPLGIPTYFMDIWYFVVIWYTYILHQEKSGNPG
jgi:hypothetical protein